MNAHICDVCVFRCLGSWTWRSLEKRLTTSASPTWNSWLPRAKLLTVSVSFLYFSAPEVENTDNLYLSIRKDTSVKNYSSKSQSSDSTSLLKYCCSEV